MITIGLSGGIDRDHERAFDFAYDFVHDSAAVLVRDGEVVAAIEQERLNRIKHTNKSPGPALAFCLGHAGVDIDQVDAIAFYAEEAYVDRVLRWTHLTKPSAPPLPHARAMVQRIVEGACGRAIDESRIAFVSHHRAHAVSAYFMSGFDDALVLTLDGQGEGVSGTVYSGRGGELTLLRSIPEAHSLGFLYRDVIRFHGYDMFDEYKVMGLAPYGDPSRFRRIFRAFYDLLPDGEYALHLDRVPELYHYVKPRPRGAPFTREHSDLAAALQETLEIVGGHVVAHFAAATGHRRVCLAGGVAHNCSLNGRLAYSGLFERLFVQPAAHDAGCALGAALAVHLDRCPRQPIRALRHVAWGSEVPPRDALADALAAWSALVTIEPLTDVCATAARLIAEGQVIGWVQGRSEFGPRALGHRSILADPRPAAHKDVINRMVKKREAYRPFAPSVLEEAAADYFVLPGDQREFPYMSVVLQVRPERQALLGAVTHVDGTARVQTVSRDVDPLYWRAIDEFGRLTGVPVVLNTSFNNHAEPIVDSVEDAVVCFLTTDLHALVIGDFLVRKRSVAPEAYLALVPSLPPTVAARAIVQCGGDGPVERCELSFTQNGGRSTAISSDMYAVLRGAGTGQSARALLPTAAADDDRRAALMTELRELWSSRMVILRPSAAVKTSVESLISASSSTC